MTHNPTDMPDDNMPMQSAEHLFGQHIINMLTPAMNDLDRALDFLDMLAEYDAIGSDDYRDTAVSLTARYLERRTLKKKLQANYDAKL